MSFQTSKYQVPPKLFKKLGDESMAEPPSIASPIGMLSPRSILSKTPKLKTQVLLAIPRIMRECCGYLREDERDRTTGLFRIPGNSDNVDKLLAKYASSEDDTDDILHNFKPPVHDVATLMKRYLIQSKEPLIDEVVKKDMLQIVSRGIREAKDKQLMAYEVVVRGLDIDEGQRTALAFLLRFLLMISGDSEDNRMNVENLARIFAPIIIRDDSDDPSQQLKNIDNAIIVTEILIWNAVELFKKI